jgi:hypothetical protein
VGVVLHPTTPHQAHPGFPVNAREW